MFKIPQRISLDFNANSLYLTTFLYKKILYLIFQILSLASYDQSPATLRWFIHENDICLSLITLRCFLAHSRLGVWYIWVDTERLFGVLAHTCSPLRRLRTVKVYIKRPWIKMCLSYSWCYLFPKWFRTL